MSSLNVPPFESKYPYNPPRARSSWHCALERPSPQADNEDRVQGTYSDDNVCFIEGKTGETLTYGQLKSLSKRLAYGLRHRVPALKASGTVCIFAVNTLLYAPAFYATQAAGILVTLANPKYLVEDLVYHLKDSESQVLITDAYGLEVAQKAWSALGKSQSSLYLLQREASGSTESIWSLTGKEEYEPKELSEEELDRPCLAWYSSGTSGRPKGVITTHRNVWNVAHQVQATKPIEHIQEPWLGYLPAYHAYGCFWLFFHGARHQVRSFILEGFLPELVLDLVQKEKITMIHAVPPVVLFLANSPLVDRYDTSSIKYVLSGAAPLGSELIEKCEKRLKCQVAGGYGMTETTCVATLDTEPFVKGSVGKLIAGLTGRVKDGELQLRGPNLTSGYHNRPDANADLFDTDEEGKVWMRTGDVVEMDKNGSLWVTDRVKELIKYKGSQVAPAELEDLLLGHPSIADAAVTAIPRPEEATEVPRAYVQLQPGAEASEAEARKILDWANAKLADWKRLRGGLVFVDAVPKNPSGKLLRRVLRERKDTTVYGETFSKRESKL